MERRSFFGGVVGALTGWRYGGKEEILPVQADLSRSSLRAALEQIGLRHGGHRVRLVVTPTDTFPAREILEKLGPPAMHLTIGRAEVGLMDEGAWYVQNGTHRVWGSKGGW